MTESFQNTEGKPAPIRRAMAFQAVLEKMSVNIFDGELIVGKSISKIRGGSISPELQCDWILKELDLLATRQADPFQPLTEEEKEVLQKVVSYWQNRCMREKWNETVPEATRKYDDLLMGGGAYCGNNQYYGHSNPDYSMI